VAFIIAANAFRLPGPAFRVADDPAHRVAGGHGSGADQLLAIQARRRRLSMGHWHQQMGPLCGRCWCQRRYRLGKPILQAASQLMGLRCRRAE
jgi:hypothetical protein